MRRAAMIMLGWMLGCGAAGDGSGAGDPTSATAPAQTDASSTGGTADGSSGSEGDSAAADSSATSGDADSDNSGVGESSSSTGNEPLTDPDLPGPEPWTMSTAELVSGDDTLPLTLYIPGGDDPRPLVVFTHGFQLGPTNYASYGEHLASWGYVVVMPQLPGSLFNPRTHVELREHLVAILDWATGAGATQLGGGVDPDAIALAGHSMGGKVSLLTAATDPRPRAVFGVDPVDTAGGPGQSPSPTNPSVTPELMPEITARLALIGETTNATGGLGGACAPAEDNFRQYFTHAVSPAIEVEFLGANHMSFLDDPDCGLSCSACPAGSDDTALTLQMTRGFLVAFLEAYIRDNTGYAQWLTGAPMAADVDAGLVTFALANGF